MASPPTVDIMIDRRRRRRDRAVTIIAMTAKALFHHLQFLFK
jgi:hypothetical protein